MEQKDFFFDIDLIHLSSNIEDWFFTIPVRLTIAEIENLRKAEMEWKPEWKKRNDDPDEEYYIRKYCPEIHKKVRDTLKEYCTRHFNQEVINELDQADIYIARQDDFDMEEYCYDYLKDYLREYNDPRKDDEEFIRDRAGYAASVYEGEQRAGTIAPREVAIKVLMDGID
jgi:hypothetical protein